MLTQFERVKEEIHKVIIGKDTEIELFFISLMFNGHILLESVPGTGKTMLAKTFAQTVDSKFSRIQFTPDVLPSDVTGIQFFNPKKQEFEMKMGPIVANIVLADEINRATPRTQSSLLEVMEEQQVTIDGQTCRLEKPFVVIATQNPVESQQGTFPLPVAQMDRFFMKLKTDYPTFEEEKQMATLYQQGDLLKKIEPVLSVAHIQELQQQVQNVKVVDDVETYIVNICRETRKHAAVELGVSPRGTLALMKAAQGHAFINDRDYVTPTDVKEVAPFVITHRMYLTTEGSLTRTPYAVIQEILASVPVPVEVSYV
ncbi:MoxR family ATPase [Bacillus sp. HMF5848]|uniref:AAA family ATPase n=1 Tax=Bacillus sp. HMF5848 TaxID=2495421 RepID=UPI000F78B74A|nr:MoxR family ATPase [Bacillus sp. HMF5848]RSK26726.1 MoxR family ATPase [Bacillus sp. HMF5848]